MMGNKETDIYIKDEGYADMKFLTQDAKEWAHKMGIPNSLHEFGKEFCEQKVWYPGMEDGLYQYGIKPFTANNLAIIAETDGLVVENEFD